MLEYIWVIPLLPLLGFLLNSLLVWRIGGPETRERVAGYVASGAVLLAFVAALVAFVQLGALPEEERQYSVVLWEWINTGGLVVPLGLLLDPLSGVMMLLVTGVGGLIHVYSIGYMHGDAKVVRYFAYLNLFIVMMLVLVMADNLLLLFLGWEGVGLCSFLLIGHWYEKKVASSAAVKAFVVNRIGDAAILLAMMAIFAKFGTLNFFNITIDGIPYTGFVENASIIAMDTYSIPGQNLLAATVISFLLLIGVTGKSAQIPLFVWLPDAMAGPTPVSALIHAATMVTAGVYLMARTHTIFVLSPATQQWVVWIGALTALLAATAAIAQWDIKRVLAYSTVSQLGYMVAAAGMGIYVAAIFHLLTHGVFKALLFLGSGSVIHGTHETQDMRRMGGLKQHMRTTFWTYMIGTFALAGIFPFAGFWSKDEIIAHAWGEGMLPVFVILFISALLTAFYMGRQIALVFYGQQRDSHYHAHESGSIMTVPLVLLAIGAVIAGAMNLPVIHYLHDWLHPVFPEEAAAKFNIVLAIITTLLGAGSLYLGWNFYLQRSAKVKPGGQDPLYRGLGDIWDMMADAWMFDKLYEKWTVVPWYRGLSNFLGRIFDPQGIDGIVNGVGSLFVYAASGLRSLQSGYVRNYALAFLVGVVIIIFYLVITL
jgi:NADH-quinone oxidoreductase subunit L